MNRSVLAGLAVAAVVVAVSGAALWWWLRPVEKLPDRLVLEAAGFADLPGWADDAHNEALTAFLTSCAALAKMPAGRVLGADGLAGTAGQWRDVCTAAAKVPKVGGAADGAAARRFFEAAFTPFAARNNRDAEGLFTGYYEAELNGARKPDGRFAVPLYRRPKDLVLVDLGLFRDSLKGQRIAGRVEGGQLKPYESRAEIVAGALKGKGLELVWVDSAVDAFFLQIQGSGRVKMADGTTLGVGYDGHNGHPYYAIGRDLIERGVLTRDTVSMQAIRAWLEANSGEADKLMAKNPSFIFFRPLDGAGPPGALGVALTAERSLAVDRTFLPLGVPLWLATELPPEGDAKPLPWRRLMVAQDTGGAIRGPVRGDVFFGFGRRAEALAGRMKQPGRYWLLLPRTLAPAAS